MKASELRIGNRVLSAGQISEVQVINGIEQAFDQVYLEREEDFEWTELNRIEPIPLTSEWLERFGFALVKESPFEGLKMKYWVNNRVCLFFNESEPFNTYLLGFADQRFGKYSVVTGDWIYHVHTLQNAFYAFTGTELTIKE